MDLVKMFNHLFKPKVKNTLEYTLKTYLLNTLLYLEQLIVTENALI